MRKASLSSCIPRLAVCDSTSQPTVCTSPYKHSPHTRAAAKGSGLIGLVLLAVARAVAADTCPASDPKDALQLADRLFGQGSYRLAGECYRYSGRYDRANRAF